MAIIPNCAVCGEPMPTRREREVRASGRVLEYTVVVVKRYYHGRPVHTKCYPKKRGARI